MTSTYDVLLERLRHAFDVVAPGADPVLRPSDRGDYQANGVMALAKSKGISPRDMATEILSQALETPVALATNFSARIRGELITPQSGEYKFWVAAGGTAELWLSSDASPTNAARISAVTAATPYCKWPHINEAGSQTVTLKRGAHYFFEIRQWQANGSTQLAVRWQLPDGSEERPIPAHEFARPQKYFTAN